MPKATQLSVFMENSPGALGRIGREFTSHGINLHGLSVSDTVDHAVIRMVVSDSTRAVEILEEANMLVLENMVLEAPLPDKPGSLAQFGERLAHAGINIDYAYGSSPTNSSANATIYLRVSEIERADEILMEFAAESD